MSREQELAIQIVGLIATAQQPAFSYKESAIQDAKERAIELYKLLEVK